jgi:hypothetical protein
LYAYGILGKGLRRPGDRVLRRIFGPKRRSVTEAWRELCDKEFQILCSSSNVIHSVIDGSTALCWALASSSVS